tara:strand:- start:694 stop:939 length:246 start_codon:yes stop_codon:yes gene_type:complete
MPKGQSPRETAFAKLSLLDRQLKNAESISKVTKIRSLLQAYTGKFTGSRTPTERKKISDLKLRIDKRATSLGKNAISKGNL